MDDWAEIRRLHRAEGLSIKAIVGRLGISRNTVCKALASHEPPRYQRGPAGSIVDAVEPQIRALLAEFPDMPGHGVDGAGWSDAGQDGVLRPGGAVASVVPASGSLLAH